MNPRYFVVVNAIACGYAAVSLITGCSKKAAISQNFMAALCIIDVIMAALVSTGTGAAAAIGVVGMKGNSHLNWNRICNHFGRFCSQVAAAIGVSIIGILAFLLLALVSIAGLRRRSR
ncbi:CASP-like protein 1E1 [Nymphaea thermarum]|nr:CASP-like protein 1E1 [Nymphaea thermarum]